MEKVTGIGGLFFRGRDPEALGRWYQEHLGVTLTPSSYAELPWRQEAGPTAFSPFPENTDYFGDANLGWSTFASGTSMRWLRSSVRRAAGIQVDADPQRYPNGRFARLKDTEGNPIELWEPAS